MECTEAVKYIYKCRVFDAKGNDAASSTGTAAVQFTCTAARDDVLTSGRKLKGQTANKLFGKGGDSDYYTSTPSCLQSFTNKELLHANALERFITLIPLFSLIASL